MSRAPARGRWIQRALGATKAERARRRGALRRQLGIPRGKKIPLAVLVRAARAPGVLGQRARLALALRRLSTWRRRMR